MTIPSGNMFLCGNCHSRSTEDNQVRWREDMGRFYCAECYNELARAFYEEEELARVSGD